ncbi:MAG: ATP-binding protein [Planctomycetes bacterium]|nr:ATP-binding protein [Planctomycetota bacterium]
MEYARRANRCTGQKTQICAFAIFHIITSNRAPAEWPDIFLDPLLASAGLDRLSDKAEVLIITGTSFRAFGRRPEAMA